MKKVIAGLVSLTLALSGMVLPSAECGTALDASAENALAETDSLPDTESTESLISSDSVSALADGAEETEEFIVSTVYGTLSEGKLSWDTETEYDGAEISYFNGTETVCVDQPGNQTEFTIPDDAKGVIRKQGYGVFTVRTYVNTSGEKLIMDRLTVNYFMKPESAVNGISASSLQDKINLSWYPTSGANCYRIYTTNGNSSAYTKYVGETNKLSMSINVSSGTCYSYKIIPVNKFVFNGKTIYSAADSGGVISTASKPAKVSGVKIDKSGANSTVISWNSTECTGYIIERSVDGGGYKRIKTISNTGNKKISYTDKSVTSGPKYSYRIKAYVKDANSTVHNGEYSDAVKCSVKISEPTFSTERTGLYAVTLEWKAVDDVDGYVVSIYKDGKWENHKTTKLSRTFKGLQSHVKYPVRVRAYKTVDGKKYYSHYTTKSVWTDSKLKSTGSFKIYSSKSTGSKVIKYMSAGSVVQQKGSSSNGWTKVYIPGTGKKQIGYIKTSGMKYYANLNLTPINQNSYAGGQVAPLGCEETSLASVLRNQFGFNVTKNELIDNYLNLAPFTYSNGRWNVSADPNYAFWGSPYHSCEPDGNGYGVYAPAIAQSANMYLRDHNADSDYQIELNTDYYTGNNPNGCKFDPSKLDLGDTKISGGLDVNGIKAELQKGHNLIVWYDCSYNPYISRTQTLTKGQKYTNPGSGTYSFKWYGHQHTVVLTGYDDTTEEFIIANVYNGNRNSSVGYTMRLKYSTFMNGYTKMGRQSVVIYEK